MLYEYNQTTNVMTITNETRLGATLTPSNVDVHSSPKCVHMYEELADKT
jgi:hypothetical protein